MQYSTNYNLNLVEGTDIVNPLVIDKPNYQTIDGAMKANKDTGVNSATHTKAGTVHAIVRSNTDADVFRFVASAPFTAGDTFTVDGVAVTGINTAGEGLQTNDFIIGASVLCVLNSGTLTLNVNKQVTIPSTYDAADIVFDNTATSLTSVNVQNAIVELSYRVIASSLSTGTYYDKLISLTTAFNNLSSAEQLRCKLLYGNNIADIEQRTGMFTRTIINASGNLVVDHFRLTGAAFSNTAGVGADISATSDATIFSLILV